MTLGEILKAALEKVNIQNFKVIELGPRLVQLTNGEVVIDIDYDWRDRVLTASYLSVEEQHSVESLGELNQLFYPRGSVNRLLSKRTNGRIGDPLFNIDNPGEAISVVSQFLEDIVAYLPDLLAMTLPADEDIRYEPGPVPIWEK